MTADLGYLPRKPKALVTVCDVLLDWLNSDDVRRRAWFTAGSPEAYNSSLCLAVKRRLRFFVEQASCTEIVGAPPINVAAVDKLTSRVDAVILGKGVREWALAQATPKPPAAEPKAEPKRKRRGRPKKSEAPGDMLIIGAIRVLYRERSVDDPPLGKDIAEKATTTATTVMNFMKARFGSQAKFAAAWCRGEIPDKLAEWQD